MREGLSLVGLACYLFYLTRARRWWPSPARCSS
jgi:hypothetical protein